MFNYKCNFYFVWNGLEQVFYKNDSCTVEKFGAFRVCFRTHRVTGSHVHSTGIIAVIAKCYVVTLVVGIGLRPATRFTIGYWIAISWSKF